MKRKTLNIAVVILLALSMLILPACSGYVAPSATKQSPIISAEQMDSNLREFLQISNDKPDGIGGSRAFTSDSATEAANLLYKKYTATQGDVVGAPLVYDKIKVLAMEDTQFELEYMVGNNLNKRTAFNVVARYESETAKNNENKEQIIIGATYDNSVGDPQQDKVGSTSLGAIENGTGVAAVMSLIDYVNQAKIDYGFDIVFCFFAGAYGSNGAINYVDKTMSASERLNTLLMINLYRLGGERKYIYSNEVPTKANEFLFEQGSKAGLEFYKMPKNMPIIEKQYISKVPYLHWGMIGDHAPFMVRDIPVANILGGYYGGLNITDLEKKGMVNLGSTKDDTYTNLLKYRDGYAQNMSDTATLIINSINQADFASVMRSSRESVYDYSFWANPLWAELIVLGVIVLLIVLVILLVKHFEKKYPYKPIVRKLKIAVFGLDYETQTPEDVYVDIKKKRDPFSGY